MPEVASTMAILHLDIHEVHFREIAASATVVTTLFVSCRFVEKAMIRKQRYPPIDQRLENTITVTRCRNKTVATS